MSTDEQAIRDTITLWLSATREGDAATVLSLMADDVLFMTPGSEPFGKAKFSESFASMKGMSIDGESTMLEVDIHGDWAWARSYLTVRVRLANDAGDTPASERAGYVLSIFRRSVEGKWQLYRDANLLDRF